MLENLFERLLAMGLLRELTLTEVLACLNGTIIITAENLFHGENGYNRWSVQEFVVDEQTKGELEMIHLIGDNVTRFFVNSEPA